MRPFADLLVMLGVGFASALVPVVNIEAYLGARGALGALDSVSSIWLLGLAAALGQVAGKVCWFLLGAQSLRWQWVRRRMDTPKARERLARWQARTHDRPVVAGGLVFASAFTGFPPFAILAVVAGQLRMSLLLFCTLGLVGRWLRFAAVLGGAGWLSDLMR